METDFKTQAAKSLSELAAHEPYARRDTIIDPALRTKIIQLIVSLIERAADVPHVRSLWYISDPSLVFAIPHDYYIHITSNCGWATMEGHQKKPVPTYYVNWNFIHPGKDWRSPRRCMDDGGFSGDENELAPIFNSLDSSGLWQSLIEEYLRGKNQEEARIKESLNLIMTKILCPCSGED